MIPEIEFNRVVTGVYNNFIFTYYPSTHFVEETLVEIEFFDSINPDIRIFDMSIYANFISNDIKFNKAVLEVIFMYLTIESDEEDITNILMEFDSDTFIKTATIPAYELNKHKLNRDLIKGLIDNISKSIISNIKDGLVIGWRRGLDDYSVGVLYV